MTKLSYEIYNVKTDEILGACTDYAECLARMTALHETARENGVYCPYAYRAVYTPMANADPKARNYREWYRNGVPAKA